ncbi:uncharacterized protein VirK/YbjX [Sphingomonas vulcanisoli]|uniref:Uncharacterized protein VirK/YbjX n=1 Tax=Sphingomonas vulcanisoli TaxID=1658060 RepID=A0ABX0TRT3_9SPHN|nr:DUF535 family protein [Sphingomonas vulcanisoli]NIJ06859.1 uncharacterized protein VirK/YbjX [Sphingomonas vulcanisoli]
MKPTFAAQDHPKEELAPGWADPPLAFAQRYRRVLLPLLYAGSAIRHFNSLSQLWNAPDGSLLQTLLAVRPEIWTMLRVRFVSALWPARERFARIIDHCQIVEQIGHPFDLHPNEYAVLLKLDELMPGCQLMLDSPRWLLREGLLTLSLAQGRDRFFSIAFVLSWNGTELTAYVGGIQGRRGEDILDYYRAFTKACCTRPKDMVVELFRMLCEEMGVNRILCVSDRIRNGHTPYNSTRPDYVDPVTFDYDTLWRERGGILRDDGFFDLPLQAPVKDESQVPSKRRALRRKRLALLANIHTRMEEALDQPRHIRILQHEPA